ncbi:hypothetical protein VSDG_02062 [Cytospora chrysosperma]|uniref:Rhodopsin domain-containing protein n=1 Tax=Cytospora chrysosperma TaxID=252740 RepID=A0A423WDP5_CYTCH|nr:hypothetical protein VSDG_02062 [Valsa sordida]
MSSAAIALPPDEDRGPTMLGVFWAMVVVSTTMVSLRFYARYKVRGLGWDDWTILVAQMFFILGNCLFTYMVHNGGGHHVYYLTTAQILEAAKWSYISQIPIVMVYATAKASVALLTLRFIGPVSFYRRSILIFIMVTAIIVNVLVIPLTFAQCRPSRALWDTSIKGASCWPSYITLHFDYFQIAYNVFCDVVLALLPATFIYKLKMNRGRKITLTATLSLGLLAAFCGGIKIQYQEELAQEADFTWLGYNLEMWAGSEAFLLIFCSCVPTISPLWDRFVTKKLDSTYGRTPLKYTPDNSGNTPAKRSLVSGPYSRMGQSRSGETTTNVQAGSQTEMEHINAPPKRIHVLNSYNVDHGSEEEV